MHSKFISTLVLCLFVFVGYSQDGDVAKKGQDVSDLVFIVENNKKIAMSDYKGKIVFINFFANWCAPCKLEMPLLEKDVWLKHKNNKNFVMLSFGRGDDMATVQKFQKQFNATFPMYPDASKEIYKNFATKYIPRNYIIKDGKIIYASKGFTNAEFAEMVEFLGEILEK